MSDIKLAWNEKQKQRELTKNQFFFLCFFFLKVQVIRKSKTPVIERGSDKKCLGQVLTIFQMHFCLSLFSETVTTPL